MFRNFHLTDLILKENNILQIHGLLNLNNASNMKNNDLKKQIKEALLAKKPDLNFKNDFKIDTNSLQLEPYTSSNNFTFFF